MHVTRGAAARQCVAATPTPPLSVTLGAAAAAFFASSSVADAVAAAALRGVETLVGALDEEQHVHVPAELGAAERYGHGHGLAFEDELALLHAPAEILRDGRGAGDRGL